MVVAGRRQKKKKQSKAGLKKRETRRRLSTYLILTQQEKKKEKKYSVYKCADSIVQVSQEVRITLDLGVVVSQRNLLVLIYLVIHCPAPEEWPPSMKMYQLSGYQNRFSNRVISHFRHFFVEYTRSRVKKVELDLCLLLCSYK